MDASRDRCSNLVIINGESNFVGWAGKKLTFLASLAGLVELPDRLTWESMSWHDRVVVIKTAQATLPVITLDDPIPDVEYIIPIGTPAWRQFSGGDPLRAAHGLPRLWVNEEMNPVTVVPMFHPLIANKNSAWAHMLEADWLHLGEVLAGRGDEARAEFLKERLEMVV